jgi:hypothetical protein
LRQGLQQGLDQGKQLEAGTLILRLLTRRFGSLQPGLRQRLDQLSLTQLEDRGEARLAFSAMADMEAWFDRQASASEER